MCKVHKRNYIKANTNMGLSRFIQIQINVHITEITDTYKYKHGFIKIHILMHT